MNTLRIKVGAVLAALLFFTRIVCAEEHIILTSLSSTTLSGYVESAASALARQQSIDDGRPGNDHFIAAEPWIGREVALPTNMIAATLETFEPTKPNQKGSIWYRWRVNQSGVARISSAQLFQAPEPAALSTTPALSEESIFYPWGGITWVGGMVSTVGMVDGNIYLGNAWWAGIAAYRVRSETEFESIATGDYLEFNVTSDETIFVCVELYRYTSNFPGAYDDTSRLPKNLYFDVTPPPANDSFSSALSVSETAGGNFIGYTLGATRQANEPNLGPDFSGGSVWFHYKAATYGTVTIGAPQSGAPVAIFTGSDIANLSLVSKTASGQTSFFAHEGREYHVAVYAAGTGVAAFNATFKAPQYRLYETNLAGLFPPDLYPHFYGVRGATMLLYAKTADAWQLVEVEAISNQATDLLIRPASAVDGQLRITTIDETLPAPTVQLRPFRATLIPTLIGIPGQTCAVSYSKDLITWSAPQTYTLHSTTLSLPGLSAAVPSHFFRVTQSLPQNPTSGPIIGVQMQQNQPGHGGVAPPVPPL